MMGQVNDRRDRNDLDLRKFYYRILLRPRPTGPTHDEVRRDYWALWTQLLP